MLLKDITKALTTLFPKNECRWHGLVNTSIAQIIPHIVPEMSVFS